MSYNILLRWLLLLINMYSTNKHTNIFDLVKFDKTNITFRKIYNLHILLKYYHTFTTHITNYTYYYKSFFEGIKLLFTTSGNLIE